MVRDDFLAFKAEIGRNPKSTKFIQECDLENISVLHTLNFLCLTPSPEVKIVLKLLKTN